MGDITIHPKQSIQGTLAPPGDKSISHRLVMLASLADGKSSFKNFLLADDCRRSIEAFQSLGVSIQVEEPDRVTVEGVGLKGLKAPKSELFLGNSGTTMRLLLGILSGQPFKSVLSGDESLSKRPMRRVTEPLRKMGAKISGSDNANYAPITVEGASLKGIDYVNKIASAQVKSAILLAGLFAKKSTTVTEPTASRDHTERFLEFLGVPVLRRDNKFSVKAPKSIKPLDFCVPGDISAAAFFIAAAVLLEDSELHIQNVGLNPTRSGFLDAICKMGAKLEIHVQKKDPEPVGDIRVRSGKLNGIEIIYDDIPRLIDELPIIMVLASLAEGETRITGAGELRVKETDRIHSLCSNLQAIGADIKEIKDGCIIKGKPGFTGGTVDSFGDHRTAMSLIVAGLRSESGVTVKNIDCIGISYPRFLEDMRSLGLQGDSPHGDCPPLT